MSDTPSVQAAGVWLGISVFQVHAMRSLVSGGIFAAMVMAAAGITPLTPARADPPPAAAAKSDAVPADHCKHPPKPPRIPQGATATDEEMKAGHDALQTYVKILEAYQACLENEAKNAPPDTKPEVKQKWLAEADDAIDAAHEIADIYSIQLRAFKAQQ
jgi:hypothetical protein